MGETKDEQKHEPKKSVSVDTEAFGDDADQAFEDEFEMLLTYKSVFSLSHHLRKCQQFEFEGLYATIGSYLLGGFLPVIPGPCGLYRAKEVTKNAVRQWYFDIINKINKGNDPKEFDLIIGNLQLAEDRILTIASILKAKADLHHHLVPQAVFHFDPITDLNVLMKQRKRWINGSAASVIFVLRSSYLFNNWAQYISAKRKWYIQFNWYIQLFMFFLNMCSPPILFIIAFEYSLITMLDVFNITEQPATVISNWCLWGCWIIYMAFIIASHMRWWVKPITKATLYFSFLIGALVLCAVVIQVIEFWRRISKKSTEYLPVFTFIIVYVGIAFFIQPFIMAPLFSKDWVTLRNLLTSCIYYYIYAIFYFTFFFINSVCNVHDLSWGTRPDKASNPDEVVTVNPINKTRKLLIFLIALNLIIYFVPFLEQVWALAILAAPSVYQIFFSIIYLFTRDTDVGIGKSSGVSLFKPKSMIQKKIVYNKRPTAETLSQHLQNSKRHLPSTALMGPRVPSKSANLTPTSQRSTNNAEDHNVIKHSLQRIPTKSSSNKTPSILEEEFKLEMPRIVNGKRTKNKSFVSDVASTSSSLPPLYGLDNVTTDGNNNGINMPIQRVVSIPGMNTTLPPSFDTTMPPSFDTLNQAKTHASQAPSSIPPTFKDLVSAGTFATNNGTIFDEPNVRRKNPSLPPSFQANKSSDTTHTYPERQRVSQVKYNLGPELEPTPDPTAPYIGVLSSNGGSPKTLNTLNTGHTITSTINTNNNLVPNINNHNNANSKYSFYKPEHDTKFTIIKYEALPARGGVKKFEVLTQRTNSNNSLNNSNPSTTNADINSNNNDNNDNNSINITKNIKNKSNSMSISEPPQPSPMFTTNDSNISNNSKSIEEPRPKLHSADSLIMMNNQLSPQSGIQVKDRTKFKYKNNNSINNDNISENNSENNSIHGNTINSINNSDNNSKYSGSRRKSESMSYGSKATTNTVNTFNVPSNILHKQIALKRDHSLGIGSMTMEQIKQQMTPKSVSSILNLGMNDINNNNIQIPTVNKIASNTVIHHIDEDKDDDELDIQTNYSTNDNISIFSSSQYNNSNFGGITVNSFPRNNNNNNNNKNNNNKNKNNNAKDDSKNNEVSYTDMNGFDINDEETLFVHDYNNSQQL